MSACYSVWQAAYLGNDLRWRRAQNVCDQLQLVHYIAAREKRLAQQHLCKDAAHAPRVNGWAVLGKEAATQLGRPAQDRGQITQRSPHSGTLNC